MKKFQSNEKNLKKVFFLFYFFFFLIENILIRNNYITDYGNLCFVRTNFI